MQHRSCGSRLLCGSCVKLTGLSTRFELLSGHALQQAVIALCNKL